MNDVYYSPEKFGLTTVGQIDWEEPDYSFNMTVVWKDKDGKLYWASDSGCSCPSPFEDYHSIDQLETGSFFDLARYLEENPTEYGKAQVIDVLARLR